MVSPLNANAHPHVFWLNCRRSQRHLLKTTKACAPISLHAAVFTSDTDTESIAHLIEASLKIEPDLQSSSNDLPPTGWRF